jgi:DNA-binding beta-propeller fold protein YncE
MRLARIMPYLGGAALSCAASALVTSGAAGAVVPRSNAMRPAVAAPASLLHAAKSTDGCIYLSNDLSLTVSMYDGVAPYAQIGTLTSPSGYGWGVAANKKTVFVGSNADTIDEFAPCATTVLRTLYGTGAGVPYGMAAAKDGTVYATEFPSNYIDIFDPSGNLTQTTDNNMFGVYNLAVDRAGAIFVAGQTSGSFEGGVDVCNAQGGSCTPTGILYGFPGGLAFDKKQHLYVADQLGLIYEYKAPYGAANLVATYQYSTGKAAGAFANIALDTKDASIWGANTYNCASGSCAFAQQVMLPLGSGLGAATTPWTSAQAIGISVWKPSKY